MTLNIQPLILSFMGMKCVYPFGGSGRSIMLHNQLIVLEMFLISMFQRKIFLYSFSEDVSKLPERNKESY